MVERGLVAAFEGNISARVGTDRLLCTPSGLCKGTLTPEDLCIVDLTGKQRDGHGSRFGANPPRKRSSEILLHVAIYRERPDVQAVVHTHAPHATAFAITHVPVPNCISAEMEVYVGEVPVAPYATPGTAAVGESVAPLIHHANVVLLANHGVVSCGSSLEEALFRTEILEAYCRSLLLARPLGPVQRLSDENMRELMAIKQKLGLPDRRAARETFDDCDLCGNNVFGRGYCDGPSGGSVSNRSGDRKLSPSQSAPPAIASDTSGEATSAQSIDAMVREITDRVMAAMHPQGKS